VESGRIGMVPVVCIEDRGGRGLVRLPNGSKTSLGCNSLTETDACMVNSEEFERVRADICASGPASDGDNLLGMEMDAYAYLDSPLNAHGDRVPWTDMTIRRSEGAEWLITGRASGKV
jgi:hypothetical protein